MITYPICCVCCNRYVLRYESKVGKLPPSEETACVEGGSGGRTGVSVAILAYHDATGCYEVRPSAEGSLEDCYRVYTNVKTKIAGILRTREREREREGEREREEGARDKRRRVSEHGGGVGGGGGEGANGDAGMHRWQDRTNDHTRRMMRAPGEKKLLASAIDFVRREGGAGGTDTAVEIFRAIKLFMKEDLRRLHVSNRVMAEKMAASMMADLQAFVRPEAESEEVHVKTEEGEGREERGERDSSPPEPVRGDARTHARVKRESR